MLDIADIARSRILYGSMHEWNRSKTMNPINVEKLDVMAEDSNCCEYQQKAANHYKNVGEGRKGKLEVEPGAPRIFPSSQMFLHTCSLSRCESLTDFGFGGYLMLEVDE